jgi:hypothetical protein
MVHVETGGQAMTNPVFPVDRDIRRIEALYWQGVKNPSWANARWPALYQYAFVGQKRAPLNYLETCDWYNCNEADPDYEFNRRRIEQLMPHKTGKFPLIAFNYNEGFYLVTSDYEYDQFVRRIELERKKLGYPYWEWAVQ